MPFLQKSLQFGEMLRIATSYISTHYNVDMLLARYEHWLRNIRNRARWNLEKIPFRKKTDWLYYRTYLVVKFLTRKTSAPLGIIIISISQLVASVSFFALDSVCGVHQGVLPRVVQFVCRFNIVTSSSLII